MTTPKKIETLIEDIHAVFTEEHIIDQKNLDELGKNVKEVVKEAIESANEKRTPCLRMSNIGKPDRQLWYELNQGDPSKVLAFGEDDVFTPDPTLLMKFLFGHIIEQLLIFFIKESGHTLSHEQEELEINGILGHTDGCIDGVPMDIKSASKYSFSTKFYMRGLLKPTSDADPFGYKGQMSGYREALLEKYPDEIDEDKVAWVAFNKETGELCLLLADAMELYNAEDRVEHLKHTLAKTTPPDQKCHQPEINDKAGNEVLHKLCTWCPFKGDCWKDANNGKGLRVFNYATGPKYFTKVNKVPPKVKEITNG